MLLQTLTKRFDMIYMTILGQMLLAFESLLEMVCRVRGIGYTKGLCPSFGSQLMTCFVVDL
jgi:hypothetical protein